MTGSVKINLWVLADQLEDFGPILHIAGKEARIEGVRVCACAEQAVDESRVYLYREHDGVLLRNGNDTVSLPGAALEDVLNAVLEALEKFSDWEEELDRLAEERSLQGLVDAAGELLHNPILLADSEGNVLAMSSAFLQDDLGLSWRTAREEGHISMEVMGAPMYDEAGALSSWSDEPTRFRIRDNDHLVVCYIRAGGSRAAALGLREYRRPIREGDLLLFGRLCEAFASALEERTAENMGRSLADILREILDGQKIEPGLLGSVELGCVRPWQLILVSNPFRSDSIYQQSLLFRLAHFPRANISFLYENRVLVLSSERDAAALGQGLAAENGRLYYQVVLSLPFDDLRDMPARYRQCDYAMEQIKEQPGIYSSEDFCFAYLLSQFTRLNGEQNLSHPALAMLKRYDEEKNTEYYRTLFVYLLNERSILPGAEQLHIHKNSFLYRIQRIRDMIDVDLDDPAQRAYLLLSYYMEGER